MNYVARSLIVWIGLFVLAFVNGALREIVIIRIIGINNHSAHQLSCLTGIIIWTAFVTFVWGYMKIQRLKHAVEIGILWFLLTVLTETFVINRWLSNLSWEQILATYRVLNGELWIFVLLYLGIVPILIYKFRERVRL